MVSGTFFENVIKGLEKKAMKILPDSLKRRLLRVLLKELCLSRKGSFRVIMNTEWSLRNLKESGFSPEAIIDCGAYVGDWTRMIKNIFQNSKVLMVEANPEKEKSLQEVQAEYPQETDYAISLLGAENRMNARFFKMETGSSVFEEQSNVPRDILLLPMKTLDEVATEKGFLGSSLIKLDVQGYEIEVLKGATRVLERAELVLLEVSLLQYNKDAPLFGEVVHFMNSRGFVVYDFGALVRWGADNTLLQADLFFVKKDSALRPQFFDFQLSGLNPAGTPRL
jgi:FkbM family methyltransferase